jgi:hypothetical protein
MVTVVTATTAWATGGRTHRRGSGLPHVTPRPTGRADRGGLVQPRLTLTSGQATR